MTSLEEGTTQHVVVVHPGNLMRHALTSILGEFRETSISSVTSLEELQANMAMASAADVILFNIENIQQDVICLTSLRAKNPHLKMLALAHHYELEDLFALFKINIDGALLDDVSQNTLKLAFKMLKEGQKLFPSNIGQILMARMLSPCAPLPIGALDEEIELSQREQEILHCLENGEANKRIALRLDIAEATVKVHVKSILRKIGVDNRTQAAIWSLRQRTYPWGQTCLPAIPDTLHYCTHTST